MNNPQEDSFRMIYSHFLMVHQPRLDRFIIIVAINYLVN